ncbi:hypothetical protein OIU91_10955 [Streptomyces sp. NBC_01456]|nr:MULTISPECIES: hypothetical protein [unclassified Streptomyces]
MSNNSTPPPNANRFTLAVIRAAVSGVVRGFIDWLLENFMDW